MEKEKRSKKLLLAIVLIAVAAVIIGLCLLVVFSGGWKTPSTEPHGSTTGAGATVTAPTTNETQPTTEPTAHQHNYSSDVTPPTCTEEGYTTYTCACGDSYTADTVSATGHQYTQAEIAPTCTEEGYISHTCACGDSYTTDTVSATGHQYTQTVTAPTCTEDGYTTYTCACGDSYTGIPTDALGHNWGQWTVVTAPTETAEGEAERICAVCAGKESRKLDKVIPDHTHSYTAEVTKAPTCTAEGIRTYTCSCGSFYTESIKKLSHSYTDQVTAPTCTKQGYTTHTCTVCAYSYTDSRIPAVGHSYRDTVTKPTCTTDGYTTHTCTVCNYSYTDTKVAAPGHQYQHTVTKPTCTTGGYTTHTCTVCDYTYTDTRVGATGHQYQHVVTKPTCTTGGYTTHTCTVCDYTYTDARVGATGHQYQHVVTKPTCTAGGYTTHTCTACAHSYTDGETAALGHQYGVTAVTEATCTTDGSKTYTCSRCSDSYTEVIPGGHKYVAAVTEPTCTEGGFTTYTCSVCKDSYTGDAVDAKGHSWSSWKKVWPTCTEAGYSYRNCACGAEETQAGDEAYGHSYSVSGEKDGRLSYSCWRCSDSYSEDMPTRYDASLAVPKVASIQSSSSYFSINCYADFANNSGFGYQCLLARDANFTEQLTSDKEETQWNGLGYVKFSFFYVRGTYYYKVRAYKMEGDTFVYGDWSEPATVSCLNYSTNLNKQPQYTYSIYFLDNLGTNVYTDCNKAIFIKTSNPSGNTISLRSNGESVLGNIISWGKARYYDDVQYLDITDYDSVLHKVPGGYLGILDIETAGTHTVQVQEVSAEGYVVAKTFNLNVLDYTAERNKWIDNAIASQTDSSMNPKEKMDAVAKFLRNGQFRYLTNVNGQLVTLAAQPNTPWFLSKRWDSATSPSMLAVFAERIGGFEEIHNCYGDYPRGSDEWYQYHHMTYVVYEGEKYYYTVCPYTPSGEVGSVSMIDFGNTSAMTFVG